MPSRLIFYRKNVGAEGDIVEMKIWEVLRSRKTPEGLKYSLVYVRGGKRLIGYDNAEGKGHHRHMGNAEGSYPFESVDRLIGHFLADVEKIRRGGT
jgi:hypothetical protein